MSVTKAVALHLLSLYTPDEIIAEILLTNRKR
jgi:hypothetical protein